MDNTSEEVVLVIGSQVNDDNKEQTMTVGRNNLIANNQSGSSNLTSEQLVLLLLFQHQSLDPLRRNLDDFFLVLLAVITYGLQMGFLFVEVGLVQKKNVTTILFKSTLDGYVGCVSFWLVGYALAWGDGNSFVGWNHFAFVYLPGEKLAFALYQMIFANTASTLVNGGMAERMHLPCYFTYGILQTGVAYPILSRWCWNNNGWLKAMGYTDFSGSGVIHLYSGACGFVATWVIGPRTGRFQGDDSRRRQGDPIPAHSLPFVNIGVMWLIFGFAGFNAASQLTISQPGDGYVVARATFNTFLACSSGGISSVIFIRFLPWWGRRWSYVNMVNGALSGMVAVCAGCNVLAPWSAFVTGCLGALAFVCGRSLVDKLKVDDLVDSFSIHYSAGLVGLVSAPFFVPDGILFKHDVASITTLGVNLLGVVIITVWAVLWCLPLFLLLKHMGVLRVPLEMETRGLDVIEHREMAYHSSSDDPMTADTNGLPDLDVTATDRHHLVKRRRKGNAVQPTAVINSSTAVVVDIHPNVAYLPSECEHTQHISHGIIQR